MMHFHNSNYIKKTRKEHRCFLCGIKIPKGGSAHYESGKFDDDFFSRYSHHECSKEWNRQNKDAEYGDEWYWFESPEDGNHKEWNDKIRSIYGILE